MLLHRWISALHPVHTVCCGRCPSPASSVLHSPYLDTVLDPRHHSRLQHWTPSDLTCLLLSARLGRSFPRERPLELGRDTPPTSAPHTLASPSPVESATALHHTQQPLVSNSPLDSRTPPTPTVQALPDRLCLTLPACFPPSHSFPVPPLRNGNSACASLPESSLFHHFHRPGTPIRQSTLPLQHAALSSIGGHYIVTSPISPCNG